MKGCIRKSLFGVFLGVLGAAGATMLSYQWSLNVAATGLLQLLVVLLTALQVGFWEATLVSFLSCSCLWYFVIPPSFSLAIQDPQNWVALITFEISALLVSRLSARARNERTKAEQRRVEMEKLCELSLKLLFLDKGPAYGPQIVDLIQRLFSCEIVTLFDSASLAIHEWSSDPETSLKTLTRVACVTGQEVEQPETDTWVRLLRFHGRVIGALALRGKELSATATNALASLSSICMERARSFESESRAMAERRS